MLLPPLHSACRVGNVQEAKNGEKKKKEEKGEEIDKPMLGEAVGAELA